MTEGHLLFLWSPSGYELLEQAGDPPAPGSQIEHDGTTLRVTKVGPSPLPRDQRQCVYVLRV